MFLPIGTDRPLKRPTLVNHLLVGACVAVFMAQLASRGTDGASHWESAAMVHPQNIVWWTLLSYQFLHANFMHLAGNMLFLWVFGPNIEDRLGRLGYVALYLVGGMAAGGLHAAFDRNPVIGASGSIAAVTGAYIVFFPRTHIRVLLFFFLIGVYNIPAAWFIGFAIARDLFWTGVGGTNVATLAHLGGYGFGITTALTLLATRVVPREAYDLFSLGKQAKRRRDFKAAAAAGHTPWSHEAPARIRTTPAERPDPRATEIAERRAAIRAKADSGDKDAALRLYLELVHEHPASAMPRALQLDLAGWLFEAGKHSEADAAYALFLDKNPADAESNRVRLISALIRARYLKTASAARERLNAIQAPRLSEEERSLFETLRQETA